MRIKLLCFLLMFLVLTACSNNEQTTNEVKEEEQEVTEEKVVKLEEKEVQDILKTNIDSIFDAFVKLGKENRWNNVNPSDFSKIRPEVLPFATEEFADTTLKELSSEFYCECDLLFRPNISYNVRFSFQQDKENVIKVTALQPATEMVSVGSTWEFVLIKENDSWKINQWSEQLLKGQDLKLTKEEAEKLVTSDDTTATFLREYNSKETGSKAYVLIVKTKINDREMEYQTAISSKDTRVVSDFINESQEEVTDPKESAETTIHQEEDSSNQSNVEENKISITGSSKEENVAKLDQIEAQEKHRPYQGDYQLVEDYGYNYQLWDAALNEIYDVLKNQLSESNFNNLRNEQRQWIKDRDSAAEARYKEEGGGTLSRVVRVETLAKLTKERCYELVNLYMK
jgi:uncharacterized protein YecT (DUF1311 family)